MNKQKGKNSIGWCTHTSNPIKGLCPNSNCPVFHNCYARNFYKRFKLNPKIRLDEKELLAPAKGKKPSRIFIGSTIEMYHPQIPYEWISAIIAKSYDASRHTYLTLTKMPENLKSIEFPEWWWVGVTITGKESGYEQSKLIFNLEKVECNHRFISFEPLLGRISTVVLESILEGVINWIIIGLQTPYNIFTHPEKIWVRQITNYCNTGKIPLFLKDNLKPIMDENLIQEFPQNEST